MTYKITKYKGKTQIKDTKTGKSAEIDIEKFMNGGYKTLTDYALGGKEGCPDGQKSDGKGGCIPIMNFFETPEYTGGNKQQLGPTATPGMDANGNIIEYGEALPELNLENPYQNRPSFIEQNKKGTPLNGINMTQDTFEEDELRRKEDERVNNKGTKQNYNFANPYAGVDIPSAANYLGQSIKKGDTFGGVTAGLKVAAGLGRNIVSGMGQANREDQTMREALEKLRNQKNPVQYYAHGGKRDEELATGEYMRGVENENIGDYNAEIEEGEYFQTNEGDIAEVVGNKHSQGGEKIDMQAEDRVLSDQLTLGAQTAKMLASKYDLNVKAKNTYSDVLDKFRKKMKLDKIIDREAQVIKKISEQAKTIDETTRQFNLQFLAEKKREIEAEKSPIEEMRKGVFDDLFNIQEDSKPKEKNQPTNEFADGGKLHMMAQEYNISMDRAKELIQEFRNGGKVVPKYATNDADCGEGFMKNEKGECVKLTKEEAKALAEVRKGQSKNERGSFGEVTEESLQASKDRNQWYFKNFPDFDIKDKEQVKDYQRSYNEIAMRVGVTPVTVDGDWGEQTDSIDVNKLYETEKPGTTQTNNTVKQKEQNGMGMYLFPDESPMPPSGMMGTLKPEARFDRIAANEIDVNPYLQSIKDKEQTQMQSLEGLSPNVRAAAMANMRANSQSQENQIRNQVDTQNLQGRTSAEAANAQIQRQEQLQNNNYRQSFEQRTYQAQSAQDRDQNEYYNQLQSINKQKFQDIENLNMINQSNEDMVYIPGRGFQRKEGSSNKEIIDKYLRSKK